MKETTDLDQQATTSDAVPTWSRFDPQAKSSRLKQWLNRCIIIVGLLIVLVYLILFFV